MELVTIRIQKPEAVNFILGQTRSAETIDDIFEVIESAAPHLAFGIAYNEASGNRLVRVAGSDQAMIDLARTNASALGAGDIFIVFFGPTTNPRNILTVVKALPEVCGITCATSNPTEIIVGMSAQGCGIVGVIDGFGPTAVESDEETSWRRDYLHHVAGFRR
jgi:adenosine/AMP kinase